MFKKFARKALTVAVVTIAIVTGIAVCVTVAKVA